VNHHIENREPVSPAMRNFIYQMGCMGLLPSKGTDGCYAWRRQGEHGMTVVVYNELDPQKPDLAQPCRLAMEIVGPEGDVAVDLLCQYPSAAGSLLMHLVDMADKMSFQKPAAIEGYQPPSRLVLMDDPDFYVAIVPNQGDPAPDARPRYVAYRMDAEASELELLGDYPSGHRAFMMVERTAHDRRQERGSPQMRM
jgi:hypothetical protein